MSWMSVSSGFCATTTTLPSGAITRIPCGSCTPSAKRDHLPDLVTPDARRAPGNDDGAVRGESRCRRHRTAPCVRFRQVPESLRRGSQPGSSSPDRPVRCVLRYPYRRPPTVPTAHTENRTSNGERQMRTYQRRKMGTLARRAKRARSARFTVRTLLAGRLSTSAEQSRC